MPQYSWIWVPLLFSPSVSPKESCFIHIHSTNQDSLATCGRTTGFHSTMRQNTKCTQLNGKRAANNPKIYLWLKIQLLSHCTAFRKQNLVRVGPSFRIGILGQL
ncbi:hypothetical protein ACOSQ3_010528 [Xanthoceras sorbifolium]